MKTFSPLKAFISLYINGQFYLFCFESNGKVKHWLDRGAILKRINVQSVIVLNISHEHFFEDHD